MITAHVVDGQIQVSLKGPDFRAHALAAIDEFAAGLKALRADVEAGRDAEVLVGLGEALATLERVAQAYGEAV